MGVSWPSPWVIVAVLFGLLVVITLGEIVADGAGVPWLFVVVGLAVITLGFVSDWRLQARDVEGRTRLAWTIAYAGLTAGLLGVVVLVGSGVQSQGYFGGAFLGLCLTALADGTVVPPGCRVLDAW